MTEPTKPSISTQHENNFITLCEATRNGDVCLMLCTDAKTGEHATVICMINKSFNEAGEPEYQFVPVATMIEGNPYEAYIPPEGHEEAYDEDEGPNNVSPTTERTTH